MSDHLSRTLARGFTPKVEKAIEESFDNNKEAWVLLDLINAEFTSDPMSTQCFDLRIVQRVRDAVAKRKEHQRIAGIWL